MLQEIRFCLNGNRRRYLFGVVIFTALTVSAVAIACRQAAGKGITGSTGERPEKPRKIGAEPAMLTKTNGLPPPQPLQVIRITIGSEGFQPAQITVPKGRYALVLVNRANLPVLSAQLIPASGHG